MDKTTFDQYIELAKDAFKALADWRQTRLMSLKVGTSPIFLLKKSLG